MHLCIDNAAQLVSILTHTHTYKYIYSYIYEASPGLSCQSEMPSPLTSPQDVQRGRDRAKPWEQGAHVLTCILSPDWLGIAIAAFPSIL